MLPLVVPNDSTCAESSRNTQDKIVLKYVNPTRRPISLVPAYAKVICKKNSKITVTRGLTTITELTRQPARRRAVKLGSDGRPQLVLV